MINSMESINSVNDLKAAINRLENDKAAHRQMLNDSLDDTIDSLRPVNILKTLTEKVFTPGVMSNVIPTVMGLGVGFVSNKLIKGSSIGIGSRIAKGLISVALYGLTKVLIKNPDISRMFGHKAVHNVFS